jgi:hypothetical protein
MPDPILVWPDQQPLSIQIATWNTATLVQEWHEVAQFCPVPGGLQISTRPAQGGVADGTLRLEIPLALDTYNFEAWNEVRIAGTVGGPPVGGYPRHFRGYALKRDSLTDGIEQVYTFQLIDGWMRVEKPPATLVDARTWRGEDHQIIHAMAYNCWSALYPSGAATPAAPVTAPTFTQSNTGGTLTAGKWRVAYAWSNPSGPTALSNSAIPFFSSGVTTGKITITIPGTLPAGATGAQIYVAAEADALDRLWYSDVAGPGTYTITAPPTGSLPPVAPILPYPTAPHTDQPNVNNYSSVLTPSYGGLTVDTQAATLAQGLEAVQAAVPATYEVPRAMLWWKPDNAGHTAAWDWQLTWLRDTDTPIYGIVAINVNYTQAEDATHTFYYSMQRTRDGGPVGNVQTVQGDWIEASGRYATGTVTSSVSYNEIGVYLSLPPVIDRALQTDTDCVNKARQLIDAAKAVQETLTNVVTYTPYPLLGATRVRVRNLYEGGLNDPVEANLPVYTIAHAQATYTDAGIEYQLDLGAGFAELGEARTRFQGGSGTTTSTAPPAVPSWHDTPADDIVSNTYDPTSHLSTLVASWLADTTGLVVQYEPQWSFDGGVTWNAGFAVPANNPPSAVFTGPAGAAITLQVRARNAHDIASAWSASRTITLAGRQVPAAPGWVSAYTTATESATTGSAALTWTDGVGGTGTPAYWSVRVLPATGGNEMNLIVTARTILLHALLIGTTYNATVQAFTASGDGGTVSAIKAIVVAQDSPGAPSSVTVTGTRTGPNSGQANLSWNAGSGGTGTASTYEARYYVTSAGASTAVIRPVASDNRVLTIPGLPMGTQYTFNVRSITAFGIAGPWSTSAPTLTLAAQDPAPPTSLSVTGAGQDAKGGRWLDLQWTAPTGGTGTASVYEVQVQWTDSNGAVDRQLWFTITAPGTLVSGTTYRGQIGGGLEAGVAYSIKMRSRTLYGDVGTTFSNTVTYTIATPSAADLLYNAGFEIASATNSAQPDGWPITGTGANNASWGLATDQFYSGAQSFKSTANAGGTATTILTSRRFAVTAGTHYYLSLAVRRNGGTVASKVSANLGFFDSAGASVIWAGSPNVVAGALNSWNVGTLVLSTVPTNAVVAVVILTITSEASTSVWVDGLEMRIAPSATDVSPGLIDAPAKFGSAMAAIQQGSSNPGGMATDDTIYRTDLDRVGASDGTRVRSVAPQFLAWIPTVFGPYAANANILWTIVPNDLPLFIERWSSVTVVVTTNNASNFWTVTLLGQNPGTGATTLDSFTTAAQAAGTETMSDRTPNLALILAQYRYLIISVGKTGAPGNLTFYTSLRVREILS